jgi:hypothetical protein
MGASQIRLVWDPKNELSRRAPDPPEKKRPQQQQQRVMYVMTIMSIDIIMISGGQSIVGQTEGR